MRKLLFTLALIATLTAAIPATAQKHRHTPRTQELADTTTSKTKALEAFSDTTAADRDSITVSYNGNLLGSDFFPGFDGGSREFGGTFVIICVFLMFVLAPVSIIGLILFFIYMNRKNKIRMAELAMQHGQPIPANLMSSTVQDCTSYAPGIRHCCLGIGLAIFLGLIMEEVGFGIGALVFFIGLGKLLSAHLTRSKVQPTEPTKPTDPTDNEANEQ